MRSLINAGLVLQGPDLEPAARACLIIEDGRIAAIEETTPSGYFDAVHQLRDCVVLPGLIDCHAHVQLNSLDSAEDVLLAYAEDQRAGLLASRALRNARTALASGVTTLRDCGSDMSILGVRDAIAGGTEAGPRLIVAGHPITTTHGHAHWLGIAADSAVEVASATRWLIDQGVDFVKVMASGGRMTAGTDTLRPQYSADQLAIIVTEAHRRDRRVVAHALNSAAIRNCVAAGVDSIDHCLWQEPDGRVRYDPDAGRLMAAKGLRVGLTGSGVWRALLDQGTAGLQELRDTLLTGATELMRQGVKVNIHSDAGVRLTPFDRFDLSLKVFAQGLGLPAKMALKAATSTAAEAVGLGAEIGSIEVGKRADILVLGMNPLESLDALRSVRCVFRDGALVVHRGPDASCRNS